MGKQDWKGASKFLVDNAAGKNLYYTSTKWRKGHVWRFLIANHYISKASDGKLSAAEYVIGEKEIVVPALILFGHNHSEAELLFSEMNKLGAKQVFPGYDPTWSGSAGAAAGVFIVTN